MPSEYNGQILNKLGYPIEGVNVSLIKLNNKLVVEEAGKPLTSGLFEGRYNDSIIQQMETIGYTIIKTVKSNNKGIWLIRTEETPDPLLTILKMDGQVYSKTDNMGLENVYYDEIIYNPQALRYGNDYPKYIPKSTLGPFATKFVLKDFILYRTAKCGKTAYDRNISVIKRDFLLGNKGLLENGKFITTDINLKLGIVGKTPKEAYDFLKSKEDQNFQKYCGGTWTSIPVVTSKEWTESFFNTYVIPEYKSLSQQDMQTFNSYMDYPLLFNLYTTTDPKSIQEFNQFIFDIYTDTATYEKNFAETRGKIDELVELNPMWEADEFATWGPPTEISK